MCAAVKQRHHHQHYETHFFCALCGGPFARVFRTATLPARSRPRADDTDEDEDPADLDFENEFNYACDENRFIPEEAVLQTMGHAARRSRDIRRRAEERGQRPGIMKEQRRTWQAYDGARISTKQMKWTRNLRALINRRSQRQPVDSDQNTEGETAYLTGRGLVREDDNWADAFASVDLEEDAEDAEDAGNGNTHTDYPYFSESAQEHNTYGFHLYQELGGNTIKYFISSIPFHDECWSLLDLAIEDSGKERGIDNMNEQIDVDVLWNYFRGLVGVSGEQKVADQFVATVLQSDRRGEVVKRLGEVDYREAQSSGDGWYWRHEEGCHWLAADPSLYSVLKHPLKMLPSTTPLPAAPRAAYRDPFMNLPAEVVLEVTQFLTSTDTFSLKTASPAVQNIALPESYYRRFLKEEFRYLPTLSNEIERHEEALRKGRNSVDWRGSFERLRRLMRTPRPLAGHAETGSEWDEIDAGLKNRNRIWKIVKPMAEELVEASGIVMRECHGVPESKKGLTSVVRGYLGTRSGREGTVETAYFGSRGRTIIRPPEKENEAEIMEERDISAWVTEVHIWLDHEDGPVCGLGFDVNYENDEFEPDLQLFGRRGEHFVDIEMPPDKEMAGFVFCWSGSIICGVQIVYRTPDPDDYTYSRRIGIWNGGVRKIIVPSFWRKFVGITGYVNSHGFIEKIGLLEEAQVHQRQEHGFGHLGPPPPMVPLDHKEASVWKRIPPANVNFTEREGINVPDWRVCPADWEIWEPGYTPEATLETYNDKKHLQEIVGHYDDEYLRGLEFIYSGRQSRRHFCSRMGSLRSAKRSSIYLQSDESVAAIVLSFSSAGIHGVLFVTDKGNVSEMFGPRYRGTHKVYAPAPDLDHGRSKSRTIFRQEVMNKIVGLHALYDDQAEIFLQLGVIQPLQEYSIDNPPLPRAIPFDEIDEQLTVWTDGPPPEDWIIGSKPGLKPGAMEAFRQTPPFPEYTGWAKFENLRRTIIYGEMKGIRFVYSDGSGERFFGCVDENQEMETQEIDIEGGEKVVGIAVLKEPEENAPTSKLASEDDNISITSASSQAEAIEPSMGRLRFVTNWNYGELKKIAKFTVECYCFMAGIKLDFFPDRLFQWFPAYAPNPNAYYEEGSSSSCETYGKKYVGNVTYNQILEYVRFPWRKWPVEGEGDLAMADTTAAGIPESCRVTCTYFDDEEQEYPDAIKCYVSREGQFCGLLLSRNGIWAEEVFGQRSAYELIYPLSRGERITSYFETTELVTEFGGTKKALPTAIALSTNYGNTTPWLGRVVSAPKLRTPPKGHVVVGMYGVVEEGHVSFSGYRWFKVGLLYRPQKAPLDVKNPTQPSKTTCHVRDQSTQLPWFNIALSCTENLRMTKLVLNRSKLYLQKEGIGRAYCLFHPSKLQQVRVYLNNRTGIRSIRFRGTPDMGIITMGEWPVDEENVKLKSGQKMKVNGPAGERIIRIKVAFQRLQSEDRIVGIVFETNFRRSQCIVSSELSPERPVDLTGENVKVLSLPDSREVVGFHGIVSAFNIHDIGLVTQSIESATQYILAPKKPEGVCSGSTTQGDGLKEPPELRPPPTQVYEY